MNIDICIRRIGDNEKVEALSLVWSVFLEYEAPDYSKEGIEEFYKSIHDKSYLTQLCMYGAFKSHKLVGVIATRNEGTHVALFFVEGNYHRQGIGKQLFKTVLKECRADKMTVNSSPYAVPIYHKLGFCDVDCEQVVKGVRFTPMEFEMQENQMSIEQTKQGFEESFRDGAYYNKQTRDDMHLELILRCIQVGSGMRILDLGTGSGYLAFPFADKYKQVEVVGLDIVEKTLEENQRKAELEGINNLCFVSYDGMDFPFDDNSFDIVITRYALHHFPAINDTFREISRVLKNNGVFFLSDPTPNDDDVERFVDEYMQMKKDGHIRFYTKDEWKKMGDSVALMFIDDFETNIRFPRKKDTALEFDDIISRHNEVVIRGYEVEIIEDEIWITEKVNNLLFRKSK